MLVAACTAHAVHDGLTDLIYVLLPIWRSQFGISYALVGLLRGSYSGMMAGFQLLASRAARRWGRERLLVGGTALAGWPISWPGGPAAWRCCWALLLGGLGASTQHPLASSLVTEAHEAGGGVKEALSQYNFAGDIGKTLIPGAVGLLLAVASWRASVTLMGLLGLAAAALLWWLIPARAGAVGHGKPRPPRAEGSASGLRAAADRHAGQRGTHGLPHLPALPAQGQGRGYRRHRPRAVAAVRRRRLRQAVLRLPGRAHRHDEDGLDHRVRHLAADPGGGVAAAARHDGDAAAARAGLNGTSSVLYGAVPELAGAGRRDHAFALFYTGTIGGGALSPVLFGRLGDVAGMTAAVVTLAVMLLLTLPLSWQVQKGLQR